jgi:glutathione S-transferase
MRGCRRERFDQLERMLGEPWAAGAMFTLADCALAPTMLLASLLMRVLHRPAPVEGRATLRKWWEVVRTRPSVETVLREQREGLETRPTR